MKQGVVITKDTEETSFRTLVLVTVLLCCVLGSLSRLG